MKYLLISVVNFYYKYFMILCIEYYIQYYNQINIKQLSQILLYVGQLDVDICGESTISKWKS
jgi:hypothetical protein